MKSQERILVVGAGGQLGQCFRSVALGNHLIFKTSSELDVRDADVFEAALEDVQADVVINCSGYTAVDKAEEERNKAFELNADAPEMMARVCAKHDARLVHFSTDYVFNGKGTRPYVETDAPQPLGVYGASKLEGEKRILAQRGSHLILRVSWLYSPFGKNFFKTMMRLGSEGQAVKVVNDQVASPTYAADVVDAVFHLLSRKRAFGLFHFTNTGLASWFDFADEMLSPVYPDLDIQAVQTGYFPTASERPGYSKLDTGKYRLTSGLQPRSWKQALGECRALYLSMISEQHDNAGSHS